MMIIPTKSTTRNDQSNPSPSGRSLPGPPPLPSPPQSSRSRKRHLLILLTAGGACILTLLLAMAIMLANNNSSIGERRHHDEWRGISMLCPEGWSFETAMLGPAVWHTSPEAAARVGSSAAGVIAYRSEMMVSETLEGYVERHLQGSRELEGFSLVEEPTRITIGGQPAMSFVYDEDPRRIAEY